jgi:hypothetical protein
MKMLANVYFFVIPSVGGMALPGINYKALILYVQSGYYLGVSGFFSMAVASIVQSSLI